MYLRIQKHSESVTDSKAENVLVSENHYYVRLWQ